MKNSEQRIFISDLPEAATDKEIKSLFSKYGKVNSIEIKTRKELTSKNKSHFFAYVNLDTDHYNLNQCFRDFQDEPWHGDYVKLQIAKESFLDRLKREREEAQKREQKTDSQGSEELPNVNPVINIPPPKKQKFEDVETLEIQNNFKKKRTFSKEEVIEDSYEQSQKVKKSKKIDVNGALDEIKAEQNSEPELKIRKITNKIINKIPSLGHEPIVVYNLKKEKSKNVSEANLKRLESLKNLRKGYQTEKDLIKTALQNIDVQPKNKKIIFDDDITIDKNFKTSFANGSLKKKNDIFNEEDSEDDAFEGNFTIQDHLAGEKGKKLLELQSKFRNDKRFALDERFLDEEEKHLNNEVVEEEESLEREKKKELDILEQVLGKKISKSTPKKFEKASKSMLRFDPTQNTSNFELEQPDEPKKKKSKKELKKEAEQQQNNEKPEVSKEVFYKVLDNLKETFQESQGFSLLSTFKRADNDTEGNNQELDCANDNNTSAPSNNMTKNPFKYDSSDDEDETADIPHTNDTSKLNDNQKQTKPPSSRSVFWTESFFFKPDDHRLQDGFDFIEKIRASSDKEFSKVRQGLKGVIRTKVRNSERKNRMFKKKLGGSKSSKRKHIRIKKALKR